MVAESTKVRPEDEAFVQEEVLPAIEDVTQRFIEKAASVAQSEGWRPDLAQALAVLASAPFLERLLSDVPPAEAVESAITQGKQRMLGELFKSELDGGADPHTAFRRILDVQNENAERAGEAIGEIPEAWMNEALAEVDAVAAAARSPEDQVMAGLRSIAAAALTDAAEQLRAQGSAATRNPT